MLRLFGASKEQSLRQNWSCFIFFFLPLATNNLPTLCQWTLENWTSSRIMVLRTSYSQSSVTLFQSSILLFVFSGQKISLFFNVSLTVTEAQRQTLFFYSIFTIFDYLIECLFVCLIDITTVYSQVKSSLFRWPKTA